LLRQLDEIARKAEQYSSNAEALPKNGSSQNLKSSPLLRSQERDSSHNRNNRRTPSPSKRARSSAGRIPSPLVSPDPPTRRPSSPLKQRLPAPAKVKHQSPSRLKASSHIVTKQKLVSSSRTPSACKQILQSATRQRPSNPTKRIGSLPARVNSKAATGTMVGKGGDGRAKKSHSGLTIDASAADAEYEAQKNRVHTPQTDASTPASNRGTPASTSMRGAGTPAGVRGKSDLRSPGVKKSPTAVTAKRLSSGFSNEEAPSPLADFITQTDASGNASTPRSATAISNARKSHPSGPVPHIHVDDKSGNVVDDEGHVVAKSTDNNHLEQGSDQEDVCETVLDSLRLMCCCLSVEGNEPTSSDVTRAAPASSKAEETSRYGTRASEPVDIPSLYEEETRVRLLPKHHPDDMGKKCLVLDLDETLVHSSFRAVPGADFVIPVQIEDVVHFVYVAKRPGVDEFLTEMAQHYELVIYTASLNKYADPLLDLLDPNRVIRTRLFRESCVYYEGNYVKDLSLLDRDLSQAIIVDNSPSSYIFHPENAIDCSSFIDDPTDRELDQIGAFLAGVKDVEDVRDVCSLWRQYPNIDLPGKKENNKVDDDDRHR